MWTVEAKEGAKKPDGSDYTQPTCARSGTGSSSPSFANVAGVTEINSIGGYAKEYRQLLRSGKGWPNGLTLADRHRARSQQRQRRGRLHRASAGSSNLIARLAKVRALRTWAASSSSKRRRLESADVADVGWARSLHRAQPRTMDVKWWWALSSC